MDKASLAKSYLNAFMGNMSDMVRVINKEGKVTYTNESFDRNLAGCAKTEGRYCFEVFGFESACKTCPVRDVMSLGVSRQMTRKIGDKSFTVSVSPILDESGDPAAALEVYRDMTLDFNIKQNLMEQNAKMVKDLKLARSVQQALVKSVMPQVPGYTVCSGFYPCEAVGGDMFDCIVRGDEILLYVADVSGHGVMPSMLGVFFSRAVKAAYSMGIGRPSEILKYVQNEFETLELSDSIYITAFVVVLDTVSGSFLYSNAGLSVAPLIINSEITELKMNSLPISKWFGAPNFIDAVGELKPGSRILIYSDGINGIHEDSGAAMQLQSLFKKEPFISADFIKSVHKNLHTQPEDDLTLLLCCRDAET